MRRFTMKFLWMVTLCTWVGAILVLSYDLAARRTGIVLFGDGILLLCALVLIYVLWEDVYGRRK